MIGNQTNSRNSLVSRRRVLKTGTAVAVMAMAPTILRAQGRAIKIGLVTPTTGPLAIFAEPDAFVLTEFKKAIGTGIKIGNQTHAVEVIVKDSQSNPNRAAEVANELILSNKIDLMVVAHTPDTVNPVADQCEINEVPCISTDAPWQPYFFGRKGDPAKGFKWTYHFFWGAEALISTFINLYDDLATNRIVGALWPNDSDGNAFSDPQRGMPPVLMKRGYKVVNTGSFDPFAENFTSQITAFKSQGVEIVTSVLPPPTFANFWTQAAQQGFKPKIVTPGKSAEFPAAVKALGQLGKNIGIDDAPRLQTRAVRSRRRCAQALKGVGTGSDSAISRRDVLRVDRRASAVEERPRSQYFDHPVGRRPVAGGHRRRARAQDRKQQGCAGDQDERQDAAALIAGVKRGSVAGATGV